MLTFFIKKYYFVSFIWNRLTETILMIFTNRIYHRSPMQTEKSQPKGKWIMPEKRFTEFLALSVDPRVGISRSASDTDN